MKVFFVLLVLFTLFSKAETREESLLRRGFSGERLSYDEAFQFYLSTCQPRKAWSAAEKISDPKRRAAMQGLLLAMVSLDRPATPESKKKTIASETEIYPMETEVWPDEAEALQVKKCRKFPLVAISRTQEAQTRARELLSENMAFLPKSPEVYAVLSDLGLQPFMSAELLQSFERSRPDFAYLPRFRWLLSQEPEDRLEYKILGRSLNVKSLSLLDIELKTHSLEIPWLL